MEVESWNANGKLIVENGMDWLHLFRVHPETLDPIAPTRDAFNIEGSPLWTVTASRLLRRARTTLALLATSNARTIS